MANDLHARYEHFVASHRLTRQTINAVEWEYIQAGRGPCLLLLPGALGVADTSFQLIEAFEADYRVLAPRYPAEFTLLAELLDNLALLLKHECALPAHVLGGSYSGLVAQAFVRRYPELVASLILTHTGLPSPLRSFAVRIATALLGLSSDRLIQKTFLALIGTFLPAKDPIQAFWRDYFCALIPRLSRADYLSRLKIGIDFDSNYRFVAQQAPNWQGPVLIIDSPHDGIFSQKERDGLRRLYPQAEQHSLIAKGHAASLDQLEQTIVLMRRFLNKHNQ